MTMIGKRGHKKFLACQNPFTSTHDFSPHAIILVAAIAFDRDRILVFITEDVFTVFQVLRKTIFMILA